MRSDEGKTLFELRRLAGDPTTPRWARDLIIRALDLDPVDVANVLEVISALFVERAHRIAEHGTNTMDSKGVAHTEDLQDKPSEYINYMLRRFRENGKLQMLDIHWLLSKVMRYRVFLRRIAHNHDGYSALPATQQADIAKEALQEPLEVADRAWGHDPYTGNQAEILCDICGQHIAWSDQHRDWVHESNGQHQDENGRGVHFAIPDSGLVD